MAFIDLREFQENSLIETDLCIIGSGPAGLSIAKEFANTDVEVLIVESGGLEEEPNAQALYDIENVGAVRELNQNVVRNRIFGGTSHTWTGRCAPFDDIDFQQRNWIPYSGWPIDPSGLEGYIERAGENLRLGPNCYDERLWKLLKVAPPKQPLDSNLLKPQFWQFSKVSKNNRQPMRFGPYLMPDNVLNIKILLHANVTHLNTNEQGTKLESVEVSTLEKKRATIQAKAVVLCCGGIENARLLLASNRMLPNGVGNQNDVVGRFLMDHPGSVLGVFDPEQSFAVQDRFGDYWLKDGQDYTVYLHGIALSPKAQAEEQLLNAAAFLMSIVAEDDPWSAIKRLRLALKQKQWTAAAWQDLWAILRQPQAVLQGAYRLLFKNRSPLPKAETVFLYSLVEQLPDPESRVTLSEHRDALGMPLSKLNWKISDREKQTVRRLAHLICQEFQRLGLPQPQLSDWLESETDWQSNFIDRAHPIGTTRMSHDPEQGVVDPNCKVHGVEGLFIAGSSVFPTTSHANPTLMIVALSIRLADWLKTNTFNTKAVPSEQQVAYQTDVAAQVAKV